MNNVEKWREIHICMLSGKILIFLTKCAWYLERKELNCYKSVEMIAVLEAEVEINRTRAEVILDITESFPVKSTLHEHVCGGKK